MNHKKRCGRPRKFSESRALEAAVRVFWLHGYRGASVADLARAMQINAPSLYNTFGSKRDLYLETVRTYIESDKFNPVFAFSNEPDISRAVQDFISGRLEKPLADDLSMPSGCFLSTSVALSCDDVEEARDLLEGSIRAIDEELTERFEIEKGAGVLRSDFPSAERAQLLMDVRQGHMLRARAGFSDEQLRKDVEVKASLILK